MTKQISSKSKTFVRGGSNKMFSKSGVIAQRPGVTASTHGSGGGKFPKGGSTKMFGKQTVKSVRPI